MDITSAETMGALARGMLDDDMSSVIMLWTVVTVCMRAAMRGAQRCVLTREEWPMQFRNVLLPPYVTDWLQGRGYRISYEQQQDVMGLRGSGGIYPVVCFSSPEVSD